MRADSTVNPSRSAHRMDSGTYILLFAGMVLALWVMVRLVKKVASCLLGIGALALGASAVYLCGSALAGMLGSVMTLF